MRIADRARVLIAGALTLVVLAGAAPPSDATEAPSWTPAPDATWQYQLQGKIDTTVGADVFGVDLFETPPTVIDDLHAQGKHVVCYFSAGSWEKWRDDADDFPKQVLGKKLDGWPGERWLDVRRLDLLAPIMEARLDLCASRGFDGADFDNVDGYQNRTGFKIKSADQLAYNTFLAEAAHARGLAAGLKNDLGQVRELEPLFEFAVNEQCFQYRECERLLPFVDAGKNVIVIEYKRTLDQFCDKADDLGVVAMRKKLSLKVWRQACP